MSETLVNKSNSENFELLESQSAILVYMSHELRTPLNAIIGYAELILREVHGPILPEKYKDFIESILASGQHLLTIINDILDFSKINAGKIILYEQNIDLKRLCQSCFKIIESEIIRKNINLSLEIDENFPLFFADEKIIKQIILNLLSNSIKFTPEKGSIFVEVIEKKEKIEISVMDTGIGMSEKDIEIALQPFGQIKQKTRPEYHGTGLGLPLVKAFTELHKGTFNIESKLGEGTKIVLTFPEFRTSFEKIKSEIIL